MVRVRAVGSGGAGVADLPGGQVVFVHRTAPGDLARIELTRVKSRWARARLVEVLEPSPERRAAPCPHYQRCGGCTLEHLRYAEQLRWKGIVVRDALQRIGGAEVDVPDVVPSPEEFGYRSRVSFHLRRLARGRVVAGFHELERPGRVVDMGGECLLPEPPIPRVWDAIRRAWGPGAGRLPPGGALRLTLRKVVDGVVLLVEPEAARSPGGRAEAGPSGAGGGPAGDAGGSPTGDAGGSPTGDAGGSPTGDAGGSPTGDAGARALVAEVDGLLAVWWRGADGAATLLAGDPETEETFLGRTVALGPGAFLQVNRRAAEDLHQAVLREIGSPRERRFVDAYCGIGAYGRRLAHHGGRAVGIELDTEAVRAARAGAPAGFTVLEGTVEARLEEALPADTVVANPPRGGMHEGVPALLLASGVRRIVYVSCDPATLARDVERLAGGFRVSSLRAFDLFPQTAHVEAVAVLDRAS